MTRARPGTETQALRLKKATRAAHDRVRALSARDKGTAAEPAAWCALLRALDAERGPLIRLAERIDEQTASCLAAIERDHENKQLKGVLHALIDRFTLVQERFLAVVEARTRVLKATEKKSDDGVTAFPDIADLDLARLLE